MLNHLYPLFSSFIALIAAQVLKPVFYYIAKREWVPLLCFSSGGFPSSHTAMVTALALSVGMTEGFDSTLFVITLVLSLVVGYDAANVRYYAGQNIQITQKLIKDLQYLGGLKLDDPIYFTKVKEVLGHKWREVYGGGALGIAIAYGLYFLATH